MNIKNLIPEIPTGLASQVIKKNFGKFNKTLEDLILSKIAAEVMLLSVDETLGFKSDAHKKIQKKIKILEEKITKQIEYLRSWYESYFNLAIQCNGCAFNEDGKFCSIYGKNKIPFPNSSRKEKCTHRSSKDDKYKKVIYHEDN